jgi:spoIIIJ-associated protein
MYDPRSEPREFIGSTRSEALAKACSFFGSDEGELRIVDLDPEAVAGTAGRAVIVAAPPGASRARSAPRERSDRADRGDRPERGERSERFERPSRPERPERSDRRDRPGRGERMDRGERSERVRTQEDEPLEAESVGTAQSALSPIGEFILGALERMNLGPFTISESEEQGLVAVAVAGPAAGRLRSGESRAGEALQLLANQMMLRSDQPDRRVVVDVEGDADQRQAFLERMAERAADRAKETGRAVALEPMNGRDRRMIHVALRDTPDIATMSMGEGRYRQVVVVPRGAPEYEEALESSASKE